MLTKTNKSRFNYSTSLPNYCSSLRAKKSQHYGSKKLTDLHFSFLITDFIFYWLSHKVSSFTFNVSSSYYKKELTWPSPVKCYVFWIFDSITFWWAIVTQLCFGIDSKMFCNDNLMKGLPICLIAEFITDYCCHYGTKLVFSDDQHVFSYFQYF